MCQQCLTPLTAYSGQLTGETYQGKLAAKVAALNTRPIPVIVMATFHMLFAIFVPIAIFISSLPGRASTNEDDLYQAHMSTAFHSIGAVVVGLVMIPLALALFWLAWATFTQQTWTYNASFAPLIVFVIMMCTKFGKPSQTLHIYAALGVLGTAVLIFFWYRPATRDWFAL
jgi:hypothetical protein